MLRSGDSSQTGEAGSFAGKSGHRRNVALGLLITLIGAGVVYGMYAAATQSNHLSVTLAGGQPLPDGTIVKIEKVTFGRTHRLGPPPSRFAWLPDWLIGVNTDVPRIETSSNQDALMIWITHRHPAAPRRTRQLEWWTDYRLIDSHGCRFDHYSRELRTQGKQSSSSSSVSRGDRFTSNTYDPTAFSVGRMELASFPRREAEMTLQLFGADWGKAAEFEVANPAPTSYPVWTPQPLPQVQRDGKIAVALTKVEGTIDEWDSNGVTHRQQRLRPTFKISQAGKLTDHWEASDVQLSDATGNVSSDYDCRLCLHEKAWKMRTRFWRKPSADFAPEETWIVEDIPVQATGKFRPLSGAATRQNVELELLAIAGRGSYTYKNGVPGAGDQALFPNHSSTSMSVGGSSSSGPAGRQTDYDVQAGLPHVGLRVTDLMDDHHVDLLAIDDRGRRIPSEMKSQMDDEHYFGLDLPKDSRTLTLRLMVHRCRTAEYFIRPPQFKHLGRR